MQGANTALRLKHYNKMVRISNVFSFRSCQPFAKFSLSQKLAPGSFVLDLSLEPPVRGVSSLRSGPWLTCTHATDKNKYYAADNWTVCGSEGDG